MRNYLLGSALLCFSLYAPAQEKHPDSVITKAFRYLQHGNEAAYLRLFPNRTQYEKIHTSILGSPENDSIIKASLGDLSDEVYNTSILTHYSDVFKEVEKIGKEMGIDWSAVHLNRYEFDARSLKYMKNHRMGIIYFSDSREYYKLRFDEVFFSPGDGWLGIVFTHLSGKDWDKEIVPYSDMPEGDTTEHVEVRDVIMTTVSEKEPPPPPPPPPAKPRKKTGGKDVPKNPKSKS